MSTLLTLQMNRAGIEKLKARGKNYIISLAEQIKSDYPESESKKSYLKTLDKALKELSPQ